MIRKILLLGTMFLSLLVHPEDVSLKHVLLMQQENLLKSKLDLCQKPVIEDVIHSWTPEIVAGVVAGALSVPFLVAVMNSDLGNLNNRVEACVGVVALISVPAFACSACYRLICLLSKRKKFIDLSEKEKEVLIKLSMLQ